MDRLKSIVLTQAGQTTTEYATTLLVVALVSGALAAFVKAGGLDGLFGTIVNQIVERAGR